MHFPDAERTVRVNADALAEYFGSDGSPSGMLNVYRANYRPIHAVAQIVGTGTSGEIEVTSAGVRAAGDAGARSAPG
jgi:hypothetical protein